MLQEELDLRYVRTTEQLADCLTKGLPGARLIELCDEIGMVEAGVEGEY